MGRTGGGAVSRNRIRRRLRAAVRQAEARGDLAPGAYLFGAGPEVVTMPFTDARDTLAELLATARERRTASDAVDPTPREPTRRATVGARVLSSRSGAGGS